MQAQAEGLAQALATLSGGTFTPVRAHLPAAAKLLPPTLARLFSRTDTSTHPTPAPDIVIGCGAAGQAAALAAKARHNAYAICVQRPSGSAAQFDAIIAPRHDYLRHPPPANTLTTLGAIGRITPALLAARRAQAKQRFPADKQIAVLLGGSNRAYQMHAPTLAAQLQRVATRSGATLLLTPSRRTPPQVLPHLRATLGASHYFWDGTGDNPYLDILAAADGFCITADSVNMLSEASASGRGIYLLPLPPRRSIRARRAARKFTAFHTALEQRGNLRPFTDTYEFFTAPPLSEAETAAAAIWEKFAHQRIPTTRPDLL